MEILKIAVGIYIIMFSTWLFYLALMNASRILDSATWHHKVFIYPMLVVGLPLDVLFNFIIGSLIFLEIPQELLFTARLWRHKQGSGWRYKRAVWWCDTYLNPFDPSGKHC